MADNSVVQTIKDAEIDARSLSEFISKDATFTVARRLAPSVHTLDYYLEYLDTLKLLMTQKTGTVTVDGQILKTISQAVNDAVRDATLAPSESTNVFSANDYGASTTADYQTNRAAIQAANDAAVAAGGGFVTLNSGTYLVKGIIQDTRVVFSMPNVTLKSPDGLGSSIISTRRYNAVCNATKGSAVLTVASGSVEFLEVGTRVGVQAVGGMQESQKTTLSNTIDSATTSITIASSNGLTNNNTLLIDDELITYTTILAGGVLSGVVRGAYGTTATSHSSGAPVAVAKRHYATVIAKIGSTITLDKPVLNSGSNIELAYGVTRAGIVGLPILDCNKPEGGAPSSVYGYLGTLASQCIFELKIINGDIGGFMLQKGCAYNYTKRMYLHDCGVPGSTGRGSSLWLYQGCENNYFDYVEITGKIWVGVYLDDRTSTNEEGWDDANDFNTFNTVNINCTESQTAVLNMVSGRYNRFLGGYIKAPRVAISVSTNSQGVGGGIESTGNYFNNFTVDVSDYAYLFYSSGNTLTNLNIIKPNSVSIDEGSNNVHSIAYSEGTKASVPTGYTVNRLKNTRMDTMDGWTIETKGGSPSAVLGEDGYLQLGSDVSMFNNILYNTDLIPVGAGEVIGAAMQISVPAGSPAIQLRLAVTAYKGGTSLTPVGSNVSNTFTINPGTTVTLKGRMINTPKETIGVRLLLQMYSNANPNYKIKVEPKPTILIGVTDVKTMFNGDSDGAMWLGEEGASQSILF